MKLPLSLIYLIAFLSGAAVMAIELGGAKMIAPVYGTSLYVWASVLGVTLGGLAIGYFAGGKLSQHFPNEGLLFLALSVGAIFIALLPLTTPFFMAKVLGFGIRTGSLLSAMLSIMPALICLGMISPILIQLASKELKDVGNISGTIYAVSTVGGIGMTFLVGFFLIPEWGVKNSILFASVLLALIPISFLFWKKKYFIAISLLALFFLLIHYQNIEAKSIDSPMTTLYESDSLLGQITVMDSVYPSGAISRDLRINHITQTSAAKDQIPFSALPYIHRMATLGSVKPEGSKALILGLAGGSLAMEFIQRGFEVDVVELDPRMEDIAKEYFAFQPSKTTRVILDDARHFIRIADKQYDLVVIDLLVGEVQPSHVFTLEAFLRLKEIMTEDALLIINFQGHVLGKQGLGTRSVYKTLLEAGFIVKHFKDELEGPGDVLFVASLTPQDFTHIPQKNLSKCCKILKYYQDGAGLLSDRELAIEDGLIFTDDKPLLELVNSRNVERWRSRLLGLE